MRMQEKIFLTTLRDSEQNHWNARVAFFLCIKSGDRHDDKQ